MAATTEDCQKKCQAKAECLFFTYNVPYRACVLLGNVQEKRPNSPGIVSGPKYC